MTDTNQEVRDRLNLAAKMLTKQSLTPEERCFDALSAVNSALAALASAPPPAVPDAVGVRAVRLDWQRVPMTDFSSRAETPVATYRLWSHHEANGEWFWRVGSGCDVFEGSGSSEAEVRSAAQADFDRRILSSIEPTPSPEPQASNAGAVSYPAHTVEDGLNALRGIASQLGSEGDTDSEKCINECCDTIVEARAALSTPELQTGERDGGVKAWLMGDPVTGQWIEVDGHRVAYSRGMGTPAHVLAEAFKAERARADTAEGNANRWEARAEATECRPVEVEERARVALDDKTRDDAMDAAYKFVFPKLSDMQKEKGAVGVWVDAFRTAWDAAARAALRAKPEAQAIVGKEAGE